MFERHIQIPGRRSIRVEKERQKVVFALKLQMAGRALHEPAISDLNPKGKKGEDYGVSRPVRSPNVIICDATRL